MVDRFALVVVSLLAACDSKSSPETCRRVTEHYLSVSYRAAIQAEPEGETRAALAGALSKIDLTTTADYRDLLAFCQTQPTSFASCMLDAEDKAAFEACAP